MRITLRVALPIGIAVAVFFFGSWLARERAIVPSLERQPDEVHVMAKEHEQSRRQVFQQASVALAEGDLEKARHLIVESRVVYSRYQRLDGLYLNHQNLPGYDDYLPATGRQRTIIFPEGEAMRFYEIYNRAVVLFVGKAGDFRPVWAASFDEQGAYLSEPRSTIEAYMAHIGYKYISKELGNHVEIKKPLELYEFTTFMVDEPKLRIIHINVEGEPEQG